MNHYQRDLVRGTLEMLRPISKEFGEEFYERLFRLDPGLKALFHGNVENQASMFVTALHAAALGLVEEGVVPTFVRELGARHDGYGVRDPHFATFRTALLDSLKSRLGAGFTPEVRDAWAEAYDTLAVAMKEAVHGHMAEQEPAHEPARNSVF